MTDTQAPALLDALLAVHQALALPLPLPEVLDRLAVIVRDGVAGCEDASVTLLVGDDPVAVAHRGHAVLELDDGQLRVQAGPALHAHRTGDDVWVPEVASDVRWPELSSAAARLGVASLLAVPLAVDGVRLGVCSLYGRDLDPVARAAARAVAGHVAVGLARTLALARAGDVAAQLREAVNSRDVIGQAKGILMAQRAVTADEAFALLRDVSQRSNVKLRELADEVCRVGELAG